MILPYDLSFEQRAGYLYACVTAENIDRETALDYLRKVANEVAASASESLMLERDIPVVLSSADLFFTTQDFLNMVGQTRIAFVNKHASIQSEMEFAIMIGTNRGANYRLFTNVPDAERWLTGDAQ
jgi:hypothetical protein